MSAAESDTEVSAAEEPLVTEEEEAPPADPAPPAAPATLTLAELQQQVAELKVAHTKDVADLANRNKDLELELLRERDSRRDYRQAATAGMPPTGTAIPAFVS